MNKYFVIIIFSSALLFVCSPLSASTSDSLKFFSTIIDSSLTKTECDFDNYISIETQDTLVLIKEVSRKEYVKKKAISLLFSMPFPFGFMGAHRVMLGTKPWIPVVYMATFGGCFGVLPTIDFFVLLFTKDIKQYENNPQLFMWLK